MPYNPRKNQAPFPDCRAGVPVGRNGKNDTAEFKTLTGWIMADAAIGAFFGVVVLLWILGA